MVVATNGGCVGPRNVMESVEFATTTSSKHFPPSQALHLPSSRSERLHDKDALLFKSRTRKHHHNNNFLHKQRALQQPDEDDDWGVMTPRRQSAAMTPQASNKSSTNFPTGNRAVSTPPAHGQSQRQRNRLVFHHHHSSSSAKHREGGGGPLAKTPPTDRLHHFEHGKNWTTSHIITPKGGGAGGAGMTWSAESRGTWGSYNKGKSRILQKSVPQPHQEEEPMIMTDVTSRHHNQSPHYYHHHPPDQQGPELFSCTRKKTKTTNTKAPEWERKTPTTTTPKKKMMMNDNNNNDLTLFEHSRKEYDQRDKRRMDTIVNTIRSMEISQQDSSTGAVSSSTGIMEHGKQGRLKPQEGDADDSWDTHHHNTAEMTKLNASLDPVEQFRDMYKQQDYEKTNHSQEESSSSSSKPTNVTTDFGIEPMVSDISFGSGENHQNSSRARVTCGGTPQAMAQPATAKATETETTSPHKIQKALFHAKHQIYPEKQQSSSGSYSANASNVPAAASDNTQGGSTRHGAEVPISTFHTGHGNEDKYTLEENDENNIFHQKCYPRVNATSAVGLATPTAGPLLQPPRGTLMGANVLAMQSAERHQHQHQHPHQQQAQLYNHTSASQNETPKHSNSHKAKAKTSHSHDNVPKIQRARSRSPDAMRVLAPPPQSHQIPSRHRPKTPEGLHHRPSPIPMTTESGNHHRPSPIPMTTESGNQQGPKSAFATLPFGRSRSTTPTKDRLLPQRTASNESSIQPAKSSWCSSQKDRPRSLTPNRLEMVRRPRPTPGQILGKSQRYIDDAEEKLLAIKSKREASSSSLQGHDFAAEEFYQRAPTARKGGIFKSFSGSGDRLFQGADSHRRSQGGGIQKSGSGAGLLLHQKQSNGSKPHHRRDLPGYSSGSRHHQHPESPRDLPSKRWFGRKREEVPAQTKHDNVISSGGDTNVRKRGFAGRLVGSLLGSDGGGVKGKQGGDGQDAPQRPPIDNAEASVLSEQMMRQMMTFDSLMRAIEEDRKNELGAEFAVVELGDEDDAVQTHAVLMNREDVEDQITSERERRQ